MESTANLVMDPAEEKSFLKMNMRERMNYMKEVITVEPLIAAYVMASILCGPALANLEFEKSCRVNLNLNDTVCDAILAGEPGDFTDQNQEIQVLISNMHSWQQPMQSIMPLILVLFLGSYSDRHKWRKPFLLIPIFGELFAVAGCILCVVFMKSWPLEAQGVSQTVVPSFFGGQTMIVMAVFAYIADVSTVEMRTLRVGIVQIVLNVSVPAVQSFSGILFAEIGYIGVLLIAAGLYVFALVYGWFWIKEPKVPVKTSKRGLLVDIFDPKHALDTFTLILKGHPGKDRIAIFLVLLSLFVYSGVIVGEGSIFYLYTQSVFHWTPVEFSYFLTINTLIHLVGTALGVALFTKVWQISDMVIILLTFFDKILSNVVFGLARTVLLLYVAAGVSIITGVTTIAIRSLATKIVPEDDLGKAQSLFGICEALAPALAIPIYNKAVYINTLEWYPSAFFFFGIILYVLCSVIIFLLYIRDKRKDAKVPQGDVTTNDNGTNEKPIQMEDMQTTHM